MEEVLLLVLEQCPASGVNNGLGEAGRAAGKENVKRMTRRELLESKRLVRGAVDGSK